MDETDAPHLHRKVVRLSVRVTFLLHILPQLMDPQPLVHSKRLGKVRIAGQPEHSVPSVNV